MRVTIHAEAGDNTGGDGTVVEVAHDAKLLWGPTSLPNHAKVDHTLQVLVQKGEELRFRTSAGPAHDNGNDTTLWSVDITYAP